ncbi:MAG: DNA repair ATPase [Actinobacteria bacterium 13_2_20CM_2_71_6]|nr:MAG: DNA repair ATPase [Actinobacteria bacterium 13_2_20CM_2_71_6]
MTSDWTAFGRVDDDGTVYVKTAAGERVVGSWQAGTPEEGLAHFARRFDGVVTEVNLIETRLASGAGDAAHALARVKELRTELDEPHFVGDIDGLAERLDKLAATAEAKVSEVHAARSAARAEAAARKAALVEEAEALAAESTSWKVAGDRFKEILEEWKTIRGVDRKTDGELWKRYATARDTFARRRGAHFATLDASRKQAQAQKEALVAAAEELTESTEWAPTAARLKELMAEWKAAPRASKEVEQRLWDRFRAAQDAFFARRSEVFSARDTEQKAALEKRQELITQAEALDIEADPKAAQARLREIQGQWHDAGRVARDAGGNLDRRLRAVEEKVRQAMDVAWRRTTPSDNPLLTQMREQVAEAEARLARAKAAGDAKRIREAEQALASKRQFLQLAEQTG